VGFGVVTESPFSRSLLCIIYRRQNVYFIFCVDAAKQSIVFSSRDLLSFSFDTITALTILRFIRYPIDPPPPHEQMP
jgi:hypothetical protein